MLKAEKVFVVDDQSAYGAGLADEVKKVLGTAVVGNDKVQIKQTDFAAIVTKIKRQRCRRCCSSVATTPRPACSSSS